MCWDYSTYAKDIRKIIFHSLKEIARYLFYSGLFYSGAKRVNGYRFIFLKIVNRVIIINNTMGVLG